MLTTETRNEVDALCKKASEDITRLTTQRIAVLQSDVASLIAPEQPEPLLDFWQPGVNDGFFCARGDGTIVKEWWNDEADDRRVRLSGNCHPTAEAAQAEHDRTVAIRWYNNAVKVLGASHDYHYCLTVDAGSTVYMFYFPTDEDRNRVAAEGVRLGYYAALKGESC